MPGCQLQHGSVRPCPILFSPASPGTTSAALSPNWPTLDRPAPGRAGPPPRPWAAARRRGRAKPRLAVCDRVLVTLVVLRFQLHTKPWRCWSGRPRHPHAGRAGGPAAAGPAGACRPRPATAGRAAAEVGGRVRRRRRLGVELRVHASQTQVRRPRAHRSTTRRGWTERRRGGRRPTAHTTTCVRLVGRWRSSAPASRTR